MVNQQYEKFNLHMHSICFCTFLILCGLNISASKVPSIFKNVIELLILKANVNAILAEFVLGYEKLQELNSRQIVFEKIMK